MIAISVVIPAYNEEHRLPATLDELRRFMAQPSSAWKIAEVIVVNDGSSDATVACVEERQKTWRELHLLSLPQNQGKGAAVHAGFRAATQPWILMADADMATPWEELKKLVAASTDADLVMGSRALPQSEIVVRQHWLRQSMGKTFNRILRALVGLPFRDTQCGFKLIHNGDFFRAHILPRLQVQRFSWDVELVILLMHAHKKIFEVPVRWHHREESHVHIVRDSLEMLWSVWKLKWRVRLE